MSIKTLLYVVSARTFFFPPERYSECTGRWSWHAISLAFPEFDIQWIACVALLYLWSFTVVGLRLSEAACVTPVTGVALCCGSDLGAWTWPEPTVHVGRLQVRAVASIEVALAAGRPDVAHIACKELLLYKGKGNGVPVHAVKECVGRRGVVALILNLSITHCPFQHRWPSSRRLGGYQSLSGRCEDITSCIFRESNAVAWSLYRLPSLEDRWSVMCMKKGSPNWRWE